MLKSIIFLGLLGVALLPGLVSQFMSRESIEIPSSSIKLSDIEKLFASSKGEVFDQFEQAKTRLSRDIEELISQDTTRMTFDSTFGALDRAIERWNVSYAAINTVSLVSPDKDTREAAQYIIPQFTPVAVDLVLLNKDVYGLLASYDLEEALTDEQRYFIEGILSGFKMSGLDLSAKDQEHMKELQYERAQLRMEFSNTISAADGKIQVNEAGLKGLEESFIRSLEKTDAGMYIIPTDYAYYSKVMQESEVADTRKRLFKAFCRRGYPENESVLKRYIAVSDEIAKLLGYKSYAEYDIEGSMAKTPEAVEAFLADLRAWALPNIEKELALLKEHLPESVVLVDNKLYPWDVTYVMRQYQKNYLPVDTFSEYFSLKYTIPAVMEVYKEFFDVSIIKLTDTIFWHEDVEAYAVFKDGLYRGVILLDMYARPFKYSHTGHISIVPAVINSSGKVLPAVSLVLLNWHGGSDEGANSYVGELHRFCHEFGHALHALLGATQIASLSGTSVKKDFLEMPSQMLEEWLKDPAILKRISSHYLTNEPLPDDILMSFLKAERFGNARDVLHQVFLSELALAYFQSGADKDPYTIMKELYLRIMPDYFDPEYYIYASLYHLTGYGPMYYGYLWSKVYAFDLFSVIKPYGLTNKEIGAQYIEKVLAKGGSKDPEELLEDFLGRKPSSKAYFTHRGID